MSSHTTILSSLSTTLLFPSTTPAPSRSRFLSRSPFSGHCFMSLSFFIVSAGVVFLCLVAAATESRENSFSRSRSSSVSSIDRDTKEAITTLQLGESYGRKSDAVPTPCLWVGTSLGVVLLIPMSIPTDPEERMEEPVTIGPCGKSHETGFHHEGVMNQTGSCTHNFLHKQGCFPTFPVCSLLDLPPNKVFLKIWLNCLIYNVFD